MFVRPTQVVLLDEAGNPMETSLEERQLPRSRLSRSVMSYACACGLVCVYLCRTLDGDGLSSAPVCFDDCVIDVVLEFMRTFHMR